MNLIGRGKVVIIAMIHITRMLILILRFVKICLAFSGYPINRNLWKWNKDYHHVYVTHITDYDGLAGPIDKQSQMLSY